MSDGDIAIRVSSLSKCYHIYDKPADRLKQTLLRGRRQYYREFWALKDVSFEVRRGEAVGIIGRNGSGKSTLLQLITGTIRPTTGEIEANGRIAALLELGSGFNPDFTGRENVYLNGALLGLTTEEINNRFDAITAFADIGQYIDQPVKTYSSGMLVRLAFAVQVQIEPDILIVDEALAVGDALFQKRCFQQIEKLVSNGTSLLFVSHDLDVVRLMCDRVMVLYLGRVAEIGPVGEALSAPRHPYTRALIASMPGSAAPVQLPGEATSPIDPAMNACLFASRCANAAPECTAERPELLDVGHEHQAACLRL